MNQKHIDTLAEDAMHAFWAVVAKRFPDATSGDLSIERTVALTMTAHAAIREWVQNNVPTVQKGSGMPTAIENEPDLDEMLSHLDSAHVVLKGFGCFVALTQDRATIFDCPMKTDGTADRDTDDPLHMNWTEVTAPEPEFVDAVNAVFGTSFNWSDFAGRQPTVTADPTDDILDDLFHGCAFAAYVELAVACGGVPDQQATRRLAYRFYEEELAASRGRSKTAPSE